MEAKEQPYKIFESRIESIKQSIEELKTEVDDWKSRPLYLAKNAAIMYSEKTGMKFDDIFPIFQAFCDMLVEN